MAKLTTQTARKEYVCQRCKRTINKGESYYKIIQQFRPERIRCNDCRPERSELTSSEYLSRLWNLQDHIDNYDLRSEEGKDDLYSELESQRDDLQERLDNMPEQLQYAPTGEMLQERIDAIQSAIDDIDSVEYPDKDDYTVERDDYKDEDEYKEAKEDKDSEYGDAIDEFEQAIIDAVNSIE